MLKQLATFCSLHLLTLCRIYRVNQHNGGRVYVMKQARRHSMTLLLEMRSCWLLKLRPRQQKTWPCSLQHSYAGLAMVGKVVSKAHMRSVLRVQQ